MRILYISPRQCWPPVTGAKLRDYHLLRALGRNAEVTCLYFAQPGEPQPLASNLNCAQLIAVPKPKPYTAAKMLRGLFGAPLPILNYTSAEMLDAVRAAGARGRFDLAHLDSIHMEGYRAAITQELGVPLVAFNWHNIESEGMRRYAANTPSAARRAYATLTAGRMEAAEAKILREAGGHIVCSERERRQLARQAPQARIEVIDNGVDCEAFAALPASPRRHRIVFVGSMSYHANSDAAIEFAHELWPQVREGHPEWTFTIVGSDPPPPVRALAELPRVEVTGTVPDVRPYYAEAAAAIVPLRVGAGTRLKILEAMAAGVPVISTSLGAEGLDVKHGRDILIANAQQEWLAALDRIHDAAALTGAARQLVAARYDWPKLGDRLFATYQRWAS